MDVTSAASDFQRLWDEHERGIQDESGPTLPAYYPQPTPRDQDPTWEEIEKALNQTVNMTITAVTDWPATR